MAERAERGETATEPVLEPADPLRERLLDAAARVFASKGYYGTKVMDIVREAGLSSGAVYGRYTSKNELLTAAIVSSTIKRAASGPPDGRVADLIVRATQRRGPLSDTEALQLEAFVAARRDREVADALVEAQCRRRGAVQPLVDAALADGTVAPDADVESILYFVETMRLGLLLQRGAGMEPLDREAWEAFMTRLVDTLRGGQPRANTASDPAAEPPSLGPHRRDLSADVPKSKGVDT
jgi:AcrR family transcriptional regulator